MFVLFLKIRIEVQVTSFQNLDGALMDKLILLHTECLSDLFMLGVSVSIKLYSFRTHFSWVIDNEFLNCLVADSSTILIIKHLINHDVFKNLC